MKEILVICFYFYSAFNLVYLLIILLDAFFNILSDDFIEIQYKVNNQNKKFYIIGAVMHLYKKVNKPLG